MDFMTSYILNYAYTEMTITSPFLPANHLSHTLDHPTFYSISTPHHYFQGHEFEICSSISLHGSLVNKISFKHTPIDTLIGSLLAGRINLIANRYVNFSPHTKQLFNFL